MSAGLLLKNLYFLIGGIQDLIQDGETGLLVEPRHSDQITEAVDRLLNHSELSRQLGEQLQKKVRNGFTEAQMIDRIHSLYRKMLPQKGFLAPGSGLELSNPDLLISRQ